MFAVKFGKNQDRMSKDDLAEAIARDEARKR